MTASIVYSLSPAQIQKMRGLWESGMTASNVGLEMGMTKNRVISYSRRLGFTRRASPLPNGAGKPQAVDPIHPDRRQAWACHEALPTGNWLAMEILHSARTATYDEPSDPGLDSGLSVKFFWR